MTVLAVLILVALAAPAGADVTIKQTNTGRGMSGTMPSTTYIKGLKMRTEVMDGRR